MQMSNSINQQTLALAKLLGAQQRFKEALREYAHSQTHALRNKTSQLAQHWAMWLEHDREDCYHWLQRMDYFQEQAISLLNSRQ